VVISVSPHYAIEFPTMQKLRFEPRLIPTVATACLLALFVYLGNWQAGKAERRAFEMAQHSERAKLGPYSIGAAKVDPLTLQDAPVTVRGVYEPQYQFFVDNRQEDGKPGVHLVTPLKIAGTETRILINRGWLGWPQGRQVLPKVANIAGEVQVSGVASVPLNKKFLLMPEHAESLPRLWSRLDLQRFAAEQSFPVQPVVLLQDSGDASDGLVRKWPPPEDRVGMHQSYSYQWFGMALALLVFYGVASVRSSKSS
jgi:surfeit locus 1 family protein